MKTFFKTSGIAAAIGATMMFNPITATAGDSKIHPGTMCKPFSSSGLDRAYYSLGNILNIDQNGLFVYCPIVRDNTTNTNGIYRVYVRVSSGPNVSNSDRLSCRAYTLNNDGQLLSSEYVYTSTPNATRTLTFSRLTSSVNGGGAYVLGCNLPYRSSIKHYRVDER